jgi:hypothetical protein
MKGSIMAKYRIHYMIRLIGDYYVETHSLGLAYEEMFKSLKKDNSLIVHAEYPYGFEILSAGRYPYHVPKPPNVRVTTTHELNGTTPVVFANPSLFDFEAGTEPSQS